MRKVDRSPATIKADNFLLNSAGDLVALCSADQSGPTPWPPIIAIAALPVELEGFVQWAGDDIRVSPLPPSFAASMLAPPSVVRLRLWLHEVIFERHANQDQLSTTGQPCALLVRGQSRHPPYAGILVVPKSNRPISPRRVAFL